MASITEYFEKNKLNYTASASSEYSSSHSPYNVFTNNSNMYHSKENNDEHWWQISFSIPVVVASYIFYRHGSDYLKRWKISYSLDGVVFITAQEDSSNIGRNLIPFKMTAPCYCKHFRITHIEDSYGANKLFFDYFNCYGTIEAKKRNKLTCNFARYRHKLISHQLMIIMPSTITK